jgi:carbamoyltransferase
VQPASSDAGISLGAAWLGSVDAAIAPVRTQHAYLGPSYSDAEIEAVLRSCGVLLAKVDDAAAIAARLIADGKVIGWFQGGMEFGPRALGHRSILANATIKGVNDLVNRKIKLREGFRPFCPSVLEEEAPMYFDAPQFPLPYMTITCGVLPEMQEAIPAVTHIDGTPAYKR